MQIVSSHVSQANAIAPFPPSTRPPRPATRLPARFFRVASPHPKRYNETICHQRFNGRGYEVDLFSFDKSEQWAGVDLEVREIVPIAPVDENDLLRLAARAHWPDGHPAAVGILKELRARRIAPPARAPDEQWHCKPDRGLEGTWGQSRLIIGNETMMAEAGIERSSAAQVIVDCHRREHWTPVLIAARTQGQDERSSLIGVIAIGPPQPVEELPDLELIPHSRKRAGASSSHSEAPRHPRPSHAARHARSPARIATRLSRFVFDRSLAGWRLATLAAVLFVIVIFHLARFSVRHDEVAVVQRFGRVMAAYPPGSYFRWPWPIEAVTRIGPNEIRTIRLSAQAALTGDVETFPTDPGGEVHSSYQFVIFDAWLRYRISDAARFLSAAERPERLLDRMAESMLREQIGTMSIDELLTSRRGELAERTTKLLQGHWNPFDCGIEVHELAIVDIKPVPGTARLAVAEIFETAARTRTDSFEQIADAKLRRDQLINDNRAEASRRVTEAQRKSARRLESVQARIERYRTLQAASGSDPQTRRRALILDLLSQQLRESKIIVLDAPTESAGGAR